MKITRIQIIQLTNRPDRIILEVDLPSGCFPFEGNQYFSGVIESGQGKKYVEDYFPDVPCIIVKDGTKK